MQSTTLSKPLAVIASNGGGDCPVDTTTLIDSITRSITRLQPHLPEERRGRGVFVCILVQRAGAQLPPVFWGMIGRVPDEKMPIYHKFSHEKVSRTS